MQEPTCPTREELAQFDGGLLPESQTLQIGSHLDQCETCCAQMETVAHLEDTVTRALRIPRPENEYAHELGFRRAESLIEAIGKEFNSMPIDGSASAAAGDVGLDQLGPYQILEKIASGGMGTVYKARHIRLKRLVAVKVLPASRLQDPHAIERFGREMEAVGKLDHPNIVRATDAGQSDAVHFLVMELVDGIDLSKLVRRTGKLRVSDACEILRQAALGLQQAHLHGIVHRDIKPSNLMLSWVNGGRQSTDSRAASSASPLAASNQPAYASRSPEVIVKLLDLGLARLHDQHADDQTELTADGLLMGTVDYMAPEQGDDSHTVDIRADIYGLGATLYKLLTGDAPFAGGQYRTRMQKLSALATLSVPPIARKCIDLPPGLAEVVHRMLAKEVDRRFSTPTEVAEALEPFCRDHDLVTLLQQTTDAERSTDDSAAPRHSPSTQMAFAEDPMGSKLGPPGDDVGPKPSSVHPIAQPARRDTAIHRRLRFTAGIVLTVILAAALVILLQQTKHGTIVVEIDDPSIQVTVDGENIKITQATSGKEFTVKAGPQRLHVQRGDVAFHTDQFSLHRGKKVVLSAKLVQDQLQVVRLADTPTVIGSQPLKRLHESTDTPDGDSGPNRRAVAWAIDVGGSVYATDTLGAKKQVTKLEQLPVRSYKLEMVFGDGDRVTDFGVGQLAGAPAIVHLDLNGTSITDRSMQHIATLSNLEALVLNHTKVSSIGVQSLVGLPKLTSLGLNGVPLDDADLASISQLTQLRRLSVGRYDASLTDAGMAHLRKLTNLEFLFVSSGRATDASLANLAACTQLRHLELYLTRLTDAGLAHLERLQNLEKLVLRYANITDAGFKHFRDMGKLQELAFVNCKSITGSGMAELGELPKLVSLNFIATSVDDTGLEQFGRFPHVAAVILVRTKVTDTGLLRLCKRLHRISTLNLMENPQLTDGAVEPILELGGLKYLYLQNTGITARGVARIQAARPGCQIFSDYPPEEIERLVAEIRLRDS